MRNFQHKRGWRDILESRPVLILLSILLLFFAWSIFGFWQKVSETGKDKKIAEDKVAQLNQEKAALSSEINQLKTPEGVETTIRNKYGLAKPGEGVIVIVPDASQATTAPANSSGFMSFLKNLFK